MKAEVWRDSKDIWVSDDKSTISVPYYRTDPYVLSGDSVSIYVNGDGGSYTGTVVIPRTDNRIYVWTDKIQIFAKVYYDQSKEYSKRYHIKIVKVLGNSQVDRDMPIEFASEEEAKQYANMIIGNQMRALLQPTVVAIIR